MSATGETLPDPPSAGGPAPEKKGWKAVLGTLAIALAGAAFGAGMVQVVEFLGLDPGQRFRWMTPWDLLILPLVLFLVILAHEGGHLAGGMLRACGS